MRRVLTGGLGAAVLFGAALAPSASAAISAPKRIAVFDNGSYVDTANNSGAESDTLQATLRGQGHAVSTFTGTSATAISAALVGTDLLVVPEQERAALAPALDASARQTIRTYVESGQGFISAGTGGARAASLINAVSGRALADSYITSSTSLNTTNAAGTPFAGGPATLSAPSATFAAHLSGLAPGEAVYNDATRASVAVLRLGAGRIGYLGWDWFNASPLGSTDMGWLTVLDRMVAHVGAADADADGLSDATDNCSGVPNADQSNNDGDTFGDACDPDDDNDTVLDAVDNCRLASNADQANNDGDALGDVCDADDDNDTVADVDDNCPVDANADQVNTDGDSRGDACDSDDDGDDVPDADDAFPLDKGESVDTDGDGQGNNADGDDDGDGVPDAEDAFPLDRNESVDTDGDGQGNNADGDDDEDGVPDADDAFPLDDQESLDTDGDRTGNNADTDDDGDGVPDAEDAFPLDRNESVDTDGDGQGNNADIDDDGDTIADADDRYPLDATEQTDTDDDGTGDNADTDDDNDGVPDLSDAFPTDPDESVDTDGDGTGNNADTDDDGDGVPDDRDAFPLDGAEAVDTDGDGIGNNADTDDDNDGVSDGQDACGTQSGGAQNGCPLPVDKEQCKKDRYKNYGTSFKNQGDCVSFVATGARNLPAG